MVVDDIVVVGAKPLFMTDYIACGKVVPERIATIVTGIARACAETGTALVGGETAEHPGLMGADDYDVAGAAVGVVEADRLLGADRVRDGDAVIAIASSGLHSNGFSLVRHILVERGHRLRGCLGRPRHDVGRGAARADAAVHRAARAPPRRRPARGIRALALARHRRRHRREPRPRAAARIVGGARPVDLVARARVPRAQRPRRHDARVAPRAPGTSASASSPSSQRMPRPTWSPRSARSGCPRGGRARSRSAAATSTDSSRARRASTAAPCGSSAPTRADRARARSRSALIGTTACRRRAGARAAHRAPRLLGALDQRRARAATRSTGCASRRRPPIARPRDRRDPARPPARRHASTCTGSRPSARRSASARAGRRIRSRLVREGIDDAARRDRGGDRRRCARAADATARRRARRRRAAQLAHAAGRREAATELRDTAAAAAATRSAGRALRAHDRRAGRTTGAGARGRALRGGAVVRRELRPARHPRPTDATIDGCRGPRRLRRRSTRSCCGRSRRRTRSTSSSASSRRPRAGGPRRGDRR